jgi:hypothetical protein
MRGGSWREGLGPYEIQPRRSRGPRRRHDDLDAENGRNPVNRQLNPLQIVPRHNH